MIQKGGKFALSKQYVELSRKIKQMGITIKAHFMFGFDNDRWQNLWQLWKTAFLVNGEYTIVALLCPFPGTKNYYKMISEDRIMNLNWRNYTCHHQVFEHPHMSKSLGILYPVVFVFFLVTTSRLGYLLFAAYILNALR